MQPTLLIGEGDSDLCDLYQMLLTECGYKVETAVSGVDCVEKLRRLQPAALLLDGDLRWGGGDGVLAWLREEKAMAGIPVVVTTSDRVSSNLGGHLGPPVVRVLSKPFAVDALLDCLRTIVSLNSRAAPVNWVYAATRSELFVG